MNFDMIMYFKHKCFEYFSKFQFYLQTILMLQEVRTYSNRIFKIIDSYIADAVYAVSEQKISKCNKNNNFQKVKLL